jgi:hypothetical protein
MNARRAAIGFQGGQVLSLRVTEEQLKELRAALSQASNGGWREVEATDGRRRPRPRPGGLPARGIRREPRRLLAEEAL